jgi:hypothetical protein
VSFAGARIGTLVLCEAEVIKLGPVRFGPGQARRSLVSEVLRGTHVVFAPVGERPLLLGLVRLENTSPEPICADYTETWDVRDGVYRAAPGACERRGRDAICALADASAVVAAVPPEPAPRVGLALDLRIPLPPGARRELSFAYVRCEHPEEPASLVRAWRGDVAAELKRNVRARAVAS